MRLRYLGGMATPRDRGQIQRIASMAKKGAIITTHCTPDVDAIGGAFALQAHLRHNDAPVDIVVSRITPLTDPLVERLGAKLAGWEEIQPSDLRPVIVVDTNAASLLTGCTRKKFLAVVDHHEPARPELAATYRIINRQAVSVCEIIASLIPEDRIGRSSALALAVGIAGDSRRLTDADGQTLSIFNRLVSLSCENKNAIDSLAFPPLRADVAAAVMKDMRNLRTETHRGKAITVGSTSLENPAILATKVREMDIAITAILGPVGGGTTADENWYKISFRVGPAEVREGIHASRIARRASEKCGMPEDMRGGGHEDKAAAMVKGTYETIVNAVFAAAREAIDGALGGRV